MPLSALHSAVPKPPGRCGVAAAVDLRVSRIRWSETSTPDAGSVFRAQAVCRAEVCDWGWAPVVAAGDAAVVRWAGTEHIARARAGSGSGEARGSTVTVTVDRRDEHGHEDAYLSRPVRFRVPPLSDGSPVSHELAADTVDGQVVKLKISVRVREPADRGYFSPARTGISSPTSVSSAMTGLARVPPLVLPEPNRLTDAYEDWCGSGDPGSPSAARRNEIHPVELYNVFWGCAKAAAERGGPTATVPLEEFAECCDGSQCLVPRSFGDWFDGDCGSTVMSASLGWFHVSVHPCPVCRSTATDAGRSRHWTPDKVRRLHRHIAQNARLRRDAADRRDPTLFEICRGLLDVMGAGAVSEGGGRRGRAPASSGRPAGLAVSTRSVLSASYSPSVVCSPVHRSQVGDAALSSTGQQHAAAILNAHLVFEGFDYDKSGVLTKERLRKVCGAVAGDVAEQLWESIDIAFDLLQEPVFDLRRADVLEHWPTGLSKRLLADLLYIGMTGPQQVQQMDGGDATLASLRLLAAALRHVVAYRLMAPVCKYWRRLSAVPVLGGWSPRQNALPGDPDPDDPVASGSGWLFSVEAMPPFTPPESAASAPTPQELFALYLVLEGRFRAGGRAALDRPAFVSLLQDLGPVELPTSTSLTLRSAAELGLTDGEEAEWSADGGVMTIDLRKTWTSRPPRRLPCQRCSAPVRRAGQGVLRRLRLADRLKCTSCGSGGTVSESVYAIRATVDCVDCDGSGAGPDGKECGWCGGSRRRCMAGPGQGSLSNELFGAAWENIPQRGGLRRPQEAGVTLEAAARMECVLLRGSAASSRTPAPGQRLVRVSVGGRGSGCSAEREFSVDDSLLDVWSFVSSSCLEVVRCTCVTVRLALDGGADAGWSLRKNLTIDAVEQGSPAARAGLAEGMVLRRVNGQEVVSVEAVEQALSEAASPVSVIVNSDRADGWCTLQHEHRTTPPWSKPARFVRGCCSECRHGAHHLSRWHWTCCGSSSKDSAHCSERRRVLRRNLDGTTEAETWLSWGGAGVNRESISALQDGRYGRFRRDSGAVLCRKAKGGETGLAALRASLQEAGVTLADGAGIVSAVKEQTEWSTGVCEGWSVDALQWRGGFFRPAAAQRAASVLDWGVAYQEAPEEFEVIFTAESVFLTFAAREAVYCCKSAPTRQLDDGGTPHTAICYLCHRDLRSRSRVPDSGRASRLFRQLDVAGGGDGQVDENEVLFGVLNALGQASQTLPKRLMSRRLFAEVFFRAYDTGGFGTMGRKAVRELIDSFMRVEYFEAREAEDAAATKVAELYDDAPKAWEKFRLVGAVDEETDRQQHRLLSRGMISRELLAALLDYVAPGDRSPKWEFLCAHFSQAIAMRDVALDAAPGQRAPACEVPDCVVS